MTSPARRSRSCSAPTGSTSACCSFSPRTPSAAAPAASPPISGSPAHGRRCAPTASPACRTVELALAATGVTWKDVTLRAVARGDQVVVESITARSGSGTLEGGGTMALVATRTTPFALRLQLHDFLAVSRPGYEAATDGTLIIEGALAYPVVRGDLTLTHLLVRPSVLERESGISVEPDPTIEVVGLPDTPAAAEPTAADRRRRCALDGRPGACGARRVDPPRRRRRRVARRAPRSARPPIARST